MFKDKLKVIIIILSISIISSFYVLPGFLTGILTLILVIFSSIKWEIRGGLIAAFFSSFILLIMYISGFPDINLLIVNTGIITYFIIAISLGRIINIYREQNMRMNEQKNTLKERVKELKCLYDISELISKKELSLFEIFNKVVKMIPDYWRYSKDTCARIIYQNKEFKTDNFKEGRWKQQAIINIDEEKVGTIEVYFSGKSPEGSESPFLQEEQKLLNSISEILASTIKSKRAERELKKNEQDLSITLASIGDGVISTDNKGKITRMNSAAEKLTGWSFDQAKGEDLKKVFKIVSEKTGEPVVHPVEKVLKQGKVVGLANHTTLIARDGTHCQIADSAAPIKDEQGYIRGVVLVFSDVTEKYKIREKLRKSEEEKSLILNTMSEHVIYQDLEGKIIWANQAAASSVNLTKEELTGKYCYQIWHERVKRCDDCPAMETLETGKTSQGSNISSDGRFWEMEIYPVKNKDGEIENFIEISQEVTERKKAEMELRKSEERFRMLAENARDIIFRISLKPEFKFQYISPAFTDITGYRPEELYEDPDLIYKIIYEGEKPIIEQLKKGEISETAVLRWVHKNGKIIWIEQHNVLIYNEQQELVAIEGISRDITERKKHEERIKYLSYHDNLTGLYNRNYFEKELEKINNPQNLPLSMILTDVNGLKIINDTFGYKKGDQLLKEIANILEEICKKEDIIFRWGGDEFLVIQPQTKQKKAEKTCEQIRKMASRTSVDELPISIAIGSATKIKAESNIYDIIKKAEEQMYKNKLIDKRSSKGEILKTLLKTLGAKSHETEEHAWRLEKRALAVGKEYGLPSSELNKLSLLTSLHDIGKTSISEEILMKPGKLTEKEWEIMKKHPEKGYLIASASQNFSHVAKEILYHHERWDGTGYPEGLKGEEIPVLSRIASVVDAYDAMTSKRPYNPNPKSKEEAITELKRCAGTQFDPKIVEIFVELLKNELE